MNIQRLMGSVFAISFITLNASHGALHTVKDSLTGETRPLAIESYLWGDYDLLKTILVSTLHGDADVGDYQIMWRGEPITAENHATAWSHGAAVAAPIIVEPLVFATNEDEGGPADVVELKFTASAWSSRAFRVMINRGETATSILERAVERLKAEGYMYSDYSAEDEGCRMYITRSRIKEGEELVVQLLPGNEAAFLSAAAEGGMATLFCPYRDSDEDEEFASMHIHGGGGGGGSSEAEND